jgi:hypothetical protein
MRREFWCLLTLVILLPFLSAAALAARRVALVIGIGDYQTLSKLANPVSDARAVATVLRANGFEVAEHYDLPRADLLDALESFRSEAGSASAALVYYAGHGMEIDGKNVLAPKDMQVDCEHVSLRRSLSLTELFNALGGAEHQIVLLDACRNNPFPNCKRGDTGTGFNFREIIVRGQERRPYAADRQFDLRNRCRKPRSSRSHASKHIQAFLAPWQPCPTRLRCATQRSSRAWTSKWPRSMRKHCLTADRNISGTDNNHGEKGETLAAPTPLAWSNAIESKSAFSRATWETVRKRRTVSKAATTNFRLASVLKRRRRTNRPRDNNSRHS